MLLTNEQTAKSLKIASLSVIISCPMIAIYIMCWVTGLIFNNTLLINIPMYLIYIHLVINPFVVEYCVKYYYSTTNYFLLME